MPEPHTHLLGGEVNVQAVDGPATPVVPSWAPGYDLMRECPRDVVQFSAAEGARQALSFEKTDKSRWRVAAPGDRPLRAQWVVSAYELSVRSSRVDATHGAVNGASVFMYVEG